MQELSLPNLTVIDADDSVSSYALMRAAKTVATFGSTMGAEATFWGRPSVLLAPTFYSGLGIAWEPETVKKAAQLLQSPARFPSRTGRPRSCTDIYLRSRGELFRYFEADGIFEGRFRGERLPTGLSARLARLTVTLGPMWPVERILRRLMRHRWEQQVFQRG